MSEIQRYEGATMRSPFPGMDPYLESPAYWSDFHARFLTYLCDEIADRLPPGYVARLGERVYLEEPSAESIRRVVPDLAIEHHSEARTKQEGWKAKVIAVVEPVTVPVMILDELREAYIEILHQADRSLVAILELLSPANKVEPGRGEYLANRNSLLHQPVPLIELDFLLGGRRLPMLAEMPPGDYYAIISRGDRRPYSDVYAWSVRQPLPTIPIPLKAPDPDVLIELTRVFATAYQRGRYGNEIDYNAAPRVPWNAEKEAWLREVIGKARED